ncbi:MAG: hypothetical protein ACYDG6_04365 [Thermincolia bacterium]
MNIDQQILDALVGKVEAIVNKSTVEIKSEISVMKSDITAMKSDIGVMKATLQEHTDLLKALEHRTEENSAQLLLISEDVSCIKGDLANHGKEITELKLSRAEDRRIIEAMSAMVIKHESQLKTIGV